MSTPYYEDEVTEITPELAAAVAAVAIPRCLRCTHPERYHDGLTYRGGKRVADSCDCGCDEFVNRGEAR